MGYVQISTLFAGKLFVLLTDNLPQTFINTAKIKNDQIMHWILALQGYNHAVKDIPEKTMYWQTILATTKLTRRGDRNFV